MIDYAPLIERRASDQACRATAMILTVGAEGVDPDDPNRIIDEAIANGERMLANFTDNITRINAALKEKRDAGPTSEKG